MFLLKTNSKSRFWVAEGSAEGSCGRFRGTKFYMVNRFRGRFLRKVVAEGSAEGFFLMLPQKQLFFLRKVLRKVLAEGSAEGSVVSQDLCGRFSGRFPEGFRKVLRPTCCIHPFCGRLCGRFRGRFLRKVLRKVPGRFSAEGWKNWF